MRDTCELKEMWRRMVIDDDVDVDFDEDDDYCDVIERETIIILRGQFELELNHTTVDYLQYSEIVM